MLAARISFSVTLIATALVALGTAAFTLYAGEDRFSSSNDAAWWFPLALLHFILLAPLVNLLHRPAFRVGGLYLIAAILASWVMLTFGLCRWVDESKWLSSLAVIFLTGIPAGVSLLFRRKPWGAAFAWSFACFASIAGLVLLWIIWFPTGSEVDGKLASMGLMLLCSSAPVCLLLVNSFRRDRRYFRWPAITIGLCGMVLSMVGIWSETDSNELPGFAARLCLITAGTLAMVNLLLMTPRPGLVRICKWIAIVSVVFLGSTFALWVVAGYLGAHHYYEVTDNHFNWLGRMAIAALFVTMGAILCQLIARTQLRLTAGPAIFKDASSVQLICPFCKTFGNIGVRDGSCPSCRLKIHITLLEPRCPACQYVLFHNTNSRCPECGHGLKSAPVPAGVPTPPAPAA